MRIKAFLIGCALLVGAAALQGSIEATAARRVANHQAHSGTLDTALVSTLRLLAVPFPAVAADFAWLQAVQHFARLRHTPDPTADRMLAALIDLAVTFDADFMSAYRTGAVLLAESAPIGPGQPQAAIALLEKGVEAHPHRWELVFDKGFVQYRSLRKYDEAARSFLRASRLGGAPWWLRPLAANSLAEGGRRAAARALWRAQLRESHLPWMRQQAARRLQQLDALDRIDRLQQVVDAARASGLPPPYSWDVLKEAGRLEAAPRDPTGSPYIIAPTTGRVALSPASPLAPLPAEGGFVSKETAPPRSSRP